MPAQHTQDTTTRDCGHCRSDDDYDYAYYDDYDYDAYNDCDGVYGDFSVAVASGGGGGKGSARVDKRHTQRGGSNGRGTIYSSKHVRAKENLQRSSKAKTPKAALWRL